MHFPSDLSAWRGRSAVPWGHSHLPWQWAGCTSRLPLLQSWQTSGSGASESLVSASHVSARCGSAAAPLGGSQPGVAERWRRIRRKRTKLPDRVLQCHPPRRHLVPPPSHQLGGRQHPSGSSWLALPAGCEITHRDWRQICLSSLEPAACCPKPSASCPEASQARRDDKAMAPKQRPRSGAPVASGPPGTRPTDIAAWQAD
mmetsp:Transcript_35595/g.57259  ORF Transcript_35595/g.57259 Transcript_35595/m.57259 type:complete len:201 (-) Transcript_35595:16-618(-)